MKHYEFVDEVLNNIAMIVTHKVPYEHLHDKTTDTKIYTSVYHNRKYFLYYNFLNDTFSVSEYDKKSKILVQTIKIGFNPSTFFVEWKTRDQWLAHKWDNSIHIKRNIKKPEFDAISIDDRHVTYNQFLKFTYIESEFNRKKIHRQSIFYRIGFSLRMIIRI